MKIIYNDWLAKLINKLGFIAITINGTCHCYGAEISIGSPLYKHESKHVEQEKNLGFLFYIQYVLWSIIKGYKNNPFEVEAQKAEKQ